ncbi:trehalose-phosphatase [Uliginosibacterium sp. H1]|uniref:trehalose-phosphatase n=1 Tax=Uliginosibacterium sp. H1 TaxID=3114757 RepID=UPI002E18F249|nr:trehalose-phosphatase [Uliginosibacterium sp. H1]
MSHLFSPEGDHALDEIVTRKPLLALDFDGTLAPIVPLPENARTPLPISRVLARLAELMPVAIVTGRAIADVTERLGFSPHYIVGNHGAEGLPDSTVSGATQAVGRWRRALNQDFAPVLDAAGVLVEDKGHSFSLHYRLARDRVSALDAIQATVSALEPTPRVIDGKFVINLLPEGAPDKYRAAVELMRVAECDTVIFAGDDITDDVVFEQAPASWLTIRVEARDHHRARFHLNHQNEVAIFLQRLLKSIERHRL